jgi:hypothetical protein
MIPEISTACLTVLRDATHSSMVDNLAASLLGAYAIDQIDVLHTGGLEGGRCAGWARAGPAASQLANRLEPLQTII